MAWNISMSLSSQGGGGGGSTITTMSVTSAAGGSNVPFIAGQPFKQGDLPSGQTITTDTSGVTLRAVIKRTWSDGSAKHVILIGKANLSAGVPLSINIKTGSPAGGTALTSADITTAAPSASIQCGAFGTVSLSSLLASPVRTWISTVDMVECHYRGDIGSQLSAWFHVRLYADGRMWVRAIAENGYLDNGSGSVTAGANRSYVPTIIIGGSTVYNNSGASLSHYHHTRYMAEGWIGTASDAQPLHNATYLRSTNLVPNYGYTSASGTILNGLVQTYTPMGQGPHTTDMADTGFQGAIGLLPNWNALYAATGDVRAFKASVVGSSSVNSYAIVFRSKSTNDIIKPSSFGNWNPDGPAAGGTDSYAAGSLNWEVNHHPGEGYFAYLITGDYWHLETCGMSAANCWLFQNSGSGSGTSRMLQRQTRGVAWALRSVGLYSAIAPDDQITAGQVAADYRTLLGFNYSTYKTGAYSADTKAWSGSLYQYEYGLWSGTGSIAPWMMDFWVSVNGFLSEIDPIASLTDLTIVRDWMYRWTLGRLGESGISGDFDFTQAAQYGINVATSDAGTTYYQSWGAVHNATFGGYNTSATNTLQGASGADPANASTGYWGNLLPALCYAVDHRAPGARTCYNRLTGATNWSTAAATFNDTPVFGCQPRRAAFAAPYTIPSSTNTSTLIGTNTARGIKPSGMSDSDFDDSTFVPFSGGVFNPKFSYVGAYSMNNPGGHSNLYFVGSIIFDFEVAAWSRLDNANGVPYLVANTNYEIADTNGSPYYEMSSATSGQFPAGSHVYASQAFFDEGTKGSIIHVTRAGTCLESVGSPTAHKLNHATGLWTRAVTGSAATSVQFEGATAYDPNTHRYYLSGTQFWDNNFVAYLRASDMTWQTYALSGFPPSGTNYCKLIAFPQRRLLLMIDAAGALFGLDTSSASNNWVALTTTGSYASSSGQNTFVYHPRTGKFYQKHDSTSDTLNTLTPPNDRALGTGGTWTKGSVTIGGSGLPDRTLGQEHYTCLGYIEELDRFYWVPGTTQQVAIVKV